MEKNTRAGKLTTPQGANIAPNVAVKTFTDKINEAVGRLDESAPFQSPADIAAACGCSAWAVRYHCRAFPSLRLWKGSYRFYADDAQHVLILRALVGRILKSGRRLPAKLGRSKAKRG